MYPSGSALVVVGYLRDGNNRRSLMKKIIALNCGRKNQFCETFIKEAAMGAEELGVETET